MTRRVGEVRSCGTIRTELPRLLPKAIAWVEAQAAWVANSGRTLDNSEVQLARRLGVAQPERVRVALVEALPLPTDPELRAVAIQTGLLGPGTMGLAPGYSVFICRPRDEVSPVS